MIKERIEKVYKKFFLKNYFINRSEEEDGIYYNLPDITLYLSIPSDDMGADKRGMSQTLIAEGVDETPHYMAEFFKNDFEHITLHEDVLRLMLKRLDYNLLEYVDNIDEYRPTQKTIDEHGQDGRTNLLINFFLTYSYARHNDLSVEELKKTIGHND